MDLSSPELDADKNFGINLKSQRERLSLTQEDLAVRMRMNGHVCSQSTIWKIETGQRAVRVGEAIAIWESLGSDPAFPWWTLLESEEAFGTRVEMSAALRRVNDAIVILRASAREYLQAIEAIAEPTRANLLATGHRTVRIGDNDVDVDDLDVSRSQSPEFIVMLAHVEVELDRQKIRKSAELLALVAPLEAELKDIFTRCVDGASEQSHREKV